MARYLEVGTDLARRVRRGDLAAGGELPAIRECARAYATTSSTIGRAYRYLADGGVITLADRRRARVTSDGAIAASIGTGVSAGLVQTRRKVRARATSTAVIGGVIGSLVRPEALVLGAFTAHGRLRVVGRTSALSKAARFELGQLLTAPVRRHPWRATLPASRFGQLPGGRIAYTQVEPEIVVDFEHDLAFEQDRFRHAARFVRIRAELHPMQLSSWSSDTWSG